MLAGGGQGHQKISASGTAAATVTADGQKTRSTFSGKEPTHRHTPYRSFVLPRLRAGRRPAPRNPRNSLVPLTRAGLRRGRRPHRHQPGDSFGKHRGRRQGEPALVPDDPPLGREAGRRCDQRIKATGPSRQPQCQGEGPPHQTDPEEDSVVALARLPPCPLRFFRLIRNQAWSQYGRSCLTGRATHRG